MAYRTGKRAVEIVNADIRPSTILTRAAFLNAIRVNAAIGGSTNAQPHLAAMAHHAGVTLLPEDWQAHGYDIPLLADVQPAGRFLGERFHRAGGVPAIMWELLSAGKLDGTCATVTGGTVANNLDGREATDREVIRTFDAPLMERAGFRILSGNPFDFAIMKTSDSPSIVHASPESAAGGGPRAFRRFPKTGRRGSASTGRRRRSLRTVRSSNPQRASARSRSNRRGTITDPSPARADRPLPPRRRT